MLDASGYVLSVDGRMRAKGRNGFVRRISRVNSMIIQGLTVFFFSSLLSKMHCITHALNTHVDTPGHEWARLSP